MLKVRKFTKAGIAIVKSAIDGHLSGMTKGFHGVWIEASDLTIIMEFANDENLLEPEALNASIDPTKTFDSSHELGKYLCKQFLHMDIDERSSGLWTWIAIIYFDQLVERDHKSKSRLFSSYRYVFNEDNRLRYYRHLVFMPYYLSRRLGDDALVFLHSPVYVSGDFLAQAQKDEVVSNRNLAAMCEKYFFNRESRKYSPGFTSTKATDRRSMRRLVQSIIPQLNINFDLHLCSPDEIFKLLPEDFRENSYLSD